MKKILIMTIYLLLTLLCLVVIHVFIRYRRFGRMVEKIPGPRALPFVGNLPLLYGTAEHLWYALHECADQYYPIFKVWLSTTSIVFIRHPDDLKILLKSKSHLIKGIIYKNLDRWFQDGVIMSKDEKWQNRRKLLTSSFHWDNLKRYIDVTNEHTNEMIAKVKLCGKESDQDISRLFYKVLINIFCDASLDVDLRKIKGNLDDNYKGAMDELFRITIYRLIRPYIMNWMMPFISLGQKEKTALKDIFKLRDELVSKRREYHKITNYEFLKESIDNNEEILKGHKKKLAMLDHLLLAEKEGLIDAKGINEEVDNMLAAGHETAAAEMIYVIMLLAENKEAQEIARNEVIEVLDKSNGKLTMTELSKLEYLDRCIKEALRLYPAAPLFLRYMNEDLYLKNYTIPAGIDVMCMISATHRDPNFWPSPDKFDPDRFLPHLVKERHPYSYLPFSAGPRNCMGYKLALIQLKVLTAHVLYNFHLQPIDFTADLRFNTSITLHPVNRVFTKFIKIRE